MIIKKTKNKVKFDDTLEELYFDNSEDLLDFIEKTQIKEDEEYLDLANFSSTEIKKEIHISENIFEKKNVINFSK